MNDEISKKIQELIEIAKIENDSNSLIVLLALAGSRASGDDVLLAKKVQEFVKDVLLPNVQRQKDLSVLYAGINLRLN